ncbi:hypothetical protein AJ78_05216 [Emergomyces pasteurianus Ep9510]|uniref:Uncharacterized protein n=1 Tax=Emergomyces pasteurianus Ep9510 TaxID=1447872 RepID=A0A1J9PD00_9EURO|nr:hypothetical protein AJ78_05216 [Emergomyces pasteurianus Ep9510]
MSPELPKPPKALSMEVDDTDSFESEYRLRIGNSSQPSLPWHDKWTVAHISRDGPSGDLKTSISNRTCQWPHTLVNCLELEKTKLLTAMPLEAVSHSVLPIPFQSPVTTIIAKIARFE